MHEFSTIAQIVDVVLEEARKHNAVDVKEVHLEIGELTFLGIEQMEFAYEVLTKDSVLEGSRLIFEERKAKVSCDSCGYGGGCEYEDFSKGMHMFFPKLICPKCGGPVKIIGGDECKIRNIVVDVED